MVMAELCRPHSILPVSRSAAGRAMERATTLVNRFTDQHSRDYPGHLTVITFAALYLVVLALIGRQPQSGKPVRNQAILIGIAVPVGFAAIAVAIFHRALFPQSPLLASVAVIQPINQSEFAELDLQVRLQSTRAHELALGYRGAAPGFQSVANNGGYRLTPPPPPAKHETWIFEQGASTRLQPQDAVPYRVYSARGRDIVDFRIDAHYQAESGLRFENLSGRTISSLWAFAGNTAVELGTVEDGQTINIQLGENQTLDQPGADWRDRLHASQDNGEIVVAAYQALLNGELLEGFNRAAGSELLLAGVTTNPWQSTAIEDLDRIDLSLIAMRINTRANTQ